MDREKILKLLSEKKLELQRQFQVRELALFGSYSRGENLPDSDVDILVSFDHPPEARQFFGLQVFLEDLLGKPVDLVTNSALRRELQPFVEREAVRV